MSKKNENVKNVKKEKVDEIPKGSLDNTMFENNGNVVITQVPPTVDLVIYDNKDQLNELLDKADIVVKMKLVSDTLISAPSVELREPDNDNLLSLGTMQVYDVEKTEDNGPIKLIIKAKLVVKSNEFDSCSIPAFEIAMRSFIKFYIDVLKSKTGNYVPISHIIYFECRDFCRDGYVESNILDDARSTVMKILDEYWCPNFEIETPTVFFGLKSKNNFVDDEIFKIGVAEKEIKKKKKKKKDKNKK